MIERPETLVCSSRATILEPSSGNTASGLALVAKLRGYNRASCAGERRRAAPAAR
jgi:cysteine synthase